MKLKLKQDENERNLWHFNQIMQINSWALETRDTRTVEMGEETWKSHIHAASKEAAGKVATVTRFKKNSVVVAQHIICQSKAEQHGVNWRGKDFRKGARPFRLCKGSVCRCFLKDQRGKQGFKSCCVDSVHCLWLIYYCIVWMPG